MENEEESQLGQYPEKIGDEGTPPPPDPEKEQQEIQNNGVFSCPMCGSEVASDATTCPRCGAIFEQEGQIPPPTDSEEEQTFPPTDTEEEQLPLPYGVGEEQRPIPDTNVSVYEPEEEETAQQDAPGYEPGEEETAQQDVPEYEPGEEEVAPPEVKSEEELGTEQKVTSALKDYKELRKKRYLFGALTLGLGLVLFVLLWLVVVYEVIVTETENWFGFEVIFILVGAGIFFILGLFLILTYPKSSLTELLASMPMNVQTSNPEIGMSEAPDSPTENTMD